MMCIICKKKVGRYREYETNFRGRKQPRPFSNLKKTLKRHLDSEGHLVALKKNSAIEKLEEKVVCREKRIARVLGDVAYYLVKMEDHIRISRSS